MRFQILVVWVVKRCGFVSEYRRFGGTCGLRHQRRSKQVADVLRCAGRLPGLIGSSCLRRTWGRPWTSVGSTSDLLQKAFHPQVSSRQWGWHQWKGTFFHQGLKRQGVQVCRDRLRNTLPSALTSTTYAVLPTSSVWPRRRRRREKSGQTVKVNRHLNLVPRLRVNGAISLVVLRLYVVSTASTGQVMIVSHIHSLGSL